MLDLLKRSLGLKVRAARSRLGLTQDQLAVKIERTAESVSNIERGQHLPALNTLVKLSLALNTPLSYLIEDFDIEKRKSAKRLKLEARFRDLVGDLSDEHLEVAIGQVEFLAKSRR